MAILNWRFSVFSHGYRIIKLEECCEKMGKILDDHDRSKTRIEQKLEDLSEKIDRHGKLFAEHDKMEKEEYDKIAKDIGAIKRIIYMALGGSISIAALIKMLDYVGWLNIPNGG